MLSTDPVMPPWEFNLSPVQGAAQHPVLHSLVRSLQFLLIWNISTVCLCVW